MGSIKFIKEPATKTIDRFSIDCLAKLLGSVGSSSPTIFTNPPRGIRFMEYLVSPIVIPHILGGNPKPNSVTFIPNFFAVKK